MSLFCQTGLKLEKTGEQKFSTDRLVGADNFGTVFHIRNQEFIKTKEASEMNFSNIQLGDISTADVFNPLKINLFYELFNTVIILDNRLAEIAILDFNTISPFRLVRRVSTGFDSSIWLYNQNTQQLELFDYRTNKSRVKTLPVEGEVLDLCSNFNYSYLLTMDALYTYNYFGNLVQKIPNQGFTELEQSKGDLVLKKENQLFYFSQKTNEINRLKLPELLINQFFLTDETLYIYDGEILHQFHIKGN